MDPGRMPSFAISCLTVVDCQRTRTREVSDTQIIPRAAVNVNTMTFPMADMALNEPQMALVCWSLEVTRPTVSLK